MNDFNHHGWLDLPNRQGRVRDATPAEVAGDMNDTDQHVFYEVDHYAGHNELAREMRELHGYDYAAQQAKHDEMWGRIKFVLMIFVLGVAFIAGIITAARGADNGQWKDLPPEVRKWFQSPRIAPCCSLA